MLFLLHNRVNKQSKKEEKVKEEKNSTAQSLEQKMLQWIIDRGGVRCMCEG